MQRTRESILNAAEAITLSKGFGAASVNEICALSGSAKGSFFHFFPDKESLGVALADHYWEKVSHALHTAPFAKHADPLQRLEGYFDHYLKIAKNPSITLSCVLGNMAQELAPTNTVIQNACRKGFRLWEALIARDLKAAAAMYDAPAGFDAKKTATYIVSLMEGSLLMAKAHGNRSVDANNLVILKRHILSLFLKKSKKGK